MTVPVSLRSHSGRYTITAKNKSGQKHVNVRVNVLGMSVLFKDLNPSLNCCRTNLSRFCDEVIVLLGSLTVIFHGTDVPGPPKELKVTDITRSTMRLIWKLPDNDGGERIKSYFIEKKCVTDKAWTKVNIA